MFKDTAYQDELNSEAVGLMTFQDKNNTTEPCTIHLQVNNSNETVPGI